MTGILALQDYASLIDLRPKIYQRSTELDYATIVHQIFMFFRAGADSRSAYPFEQERAVIRSMLTVRDPTAPEQRLPSQIYDLIDAMLQYERDFLKTLTDATRLPVQYPSRPYLRLWRGDITTLLIDAIVNAGNQALLGCFQPTHVCIDNVIHSAAGPRLRDDCHTIMNQQHRSEPVGYAKITSAHNLPSKYVIHTVGPQIVNRDGRVTRQDAQALASCYSACLNLADEIQNIESIAFCCISTGIFSFPAREACQLAIETVVKWYEQRPTNSRIALIVFNVFTDQDEHLYASMLKHFISTRPTC